MLSVKSLLHCTGDLQSWLILNWSFPTCWKKWSRRREARERNWTWKAFSGWNMMINEGVIGGDGGEGYEDEDPWDVLRDQIIGFIVSKRSWNYKRRRRRPDTPWGMAGSGGREVPLVELQPLRLWPNLAVGSGGGIIHCRRNKVKCRWWWPTTVKVDNTEDNCCFW